MKARPHQAQLLTVEIPKVKERCFLIHSPTGSGKTFIATELTAAAAKEGLRVMLMAPRIELIGQLCEKLDENYPLNYGLITADRTQQSMFEQIQVASVDTLISRAMRRNRLTLPLADLIICDEAHLYGTAERVRLLEQYPNARIIGLTATPVNCSFFQRLVTCSNVRELTDMGYLVPAEYYAPSRPDLERIRVVRGDYEAKGVQEAMQPLLGDIVSHWMRHAPERRTVLFAGNVGHSAHMAELFRAHGVAAEHCDATTDPAERRQKFARFKSGETQLLCNVDLATYGFDLPALDCVIFARPTKSIVRYLQAVGRGLRAHPGKKNLLVLDHAGCVNDNGYADEERYWTLDGPRAQARNIKRTPGSKKKEIKAPRKLTCEECKLIFSGSLTCPGCGFHFETLAKEFYVHEGDLVPFKIEHAEEASLIQRSQFFAELKGFAQESNFKPGWAAYAYKEKFGGWPPDDFRDYKATSPSLATRRYVKSLFIRRRARENKQRSA